MSDLTLRNARTTIEDAVVDLLWLSYGVRDTVADLAGLRAIATIGIQENSLCFVTAENVVYIWRAWNVSADDAVNFVQPADVSSAQSGRWIRTEYAGTTGYLKRCEVYNDLGNDEHLLERLLGITPAIVVSFQNATHEPVAATMPGALYKYRANFTVMAISIATRGDKQAARQGSPVSAESDIDPGTGAMMGDAKNVLAGSDLGLEDVAFVEIEEERAVTISLAARRATEELDIQVLATLTRQDGTVVELNGAYQFNMQLQLASTGQDGTFDPFNQVTSGLRVPLGSGLTKTIAGGTAVVNKKKVTVAAATRLWTASKWTYRDLHKDGTYTFVESVIGADQPPVTYQTLRVGVTETDDVGVAADTLLSSAAENFGPVNKIPPPGIRHIAISPPSTSVPALTPIAFTATATFKDGSQADITELVAWNSSDTSIATIAATGIASTLVPGSTNISATKDGVTSPASTLTVT